MNRMEEYRELLKEEAVPAQLESTANRAIQRRKKRNRRMLTAVAAACLLFGAVPFFNRKPAVSPLVITVLSYGEDGNLVSKQLELGQAEEIGPELTQDEKYALYEAYGKIIQEANETYGRAMCLLPIEEINFCSVEAFRKSVIDYCEAADAPWEQVENLERNPDFWTVVVRSSVIKEYKIDTVTNNIDCVFEVEKNPQGTYEMKPTMASVYTSCKNGIICHAVEGEPEYTVADDGKTVTVSQLLRMYSYGHFACYTSVSASYTIDPATGDITAQPNP